MIISIASGKGGTGKTTVATSLALSLARQHKDIALLDCDVEEPNCHLFLNPQITDTIEVTTFVPTIDETRCSGCRNCVEICRFSALAAAGERILVFPELCHSCEGCLQVCDEGALTAGTRELGHLESGTVKGSHHPDIISFHRGLLRVGEAMSPPLIKAVRSREDEAEITIIDAPPGTSCPVIAAMSDVDFVLMVTEPTPFGLHDLKLAVEAVKVLGVPRGLIINRADLGDEAVHEYAHAAELEILMEIPFRREIAEAYSRGIPIVESFPSWRAAFQKVYERIETLVTAHSVKEVVR